MPPSYFGGCPTLGSLRVGIQIRKARALPTPVDTQRYIDCLHQRVDGYLVAEFLGWGPDSRFTRRAEVTKEMASPEPQSRALGQRLRN